MRFFLPLYSLLNLFDNLAKTKLIDKVTVDVNRKTTKPKTPILTKLVIIEINPNPTI